MTEDWVYVLLSVVKGYNLKLFTNEEKAMDWLKQL
ncbi:hypothetical protein SapgrDRAFT_0154 [Saprospira grandis DSM 2844]|uniref:Uncharacterized protein n=1 Tax=Saprospira grandis DSM 2844 TaxID=694433 RepID=J1I0W8_9BACT|nr:hypothetical protein SapgrDRAFT_0154 [Saprospira grandis DSM 2844]